jgi:hypothetical protein
VPLGHLLKHLVSVPITGPLCPIAAFLSQAATETLLGWVWNASAAFHRALDVYPSPKFRSLWTPQSWPCWHPFRSLADLLLCADRRAGTSTGPTLNSHHEASAPCMFSCYAPIYHVWSIVSLPWTVCGVSCILDCVQACSFLLAAAVKPCKMLTRFRSIHDWPTCSTFAPSREHFGVATKHTSCCS